MSKVSRKTVAAEARDVAAAAIEQNGKDPTERTELTLSNGIRLGLRNIPPWLLRRVYIREGPQPPTVYIEDKGREEENPNDPGYLAAVARHNLILQEAVLAVMLGAGTVVNEIPEGIYGPEDDEWTEMIELAGLDVAPVGSKRRYIDWLTCYALATPEDLTEVIFAASAHAGLGEEEVRQAVASFRGRTLRGAD